MPKLPNHAGTSASLFQIGIGGTGSRILRFLNGAIGNLQWNPTATRTIDLPDASGTLTLRSEMPIAAPEGLILSRNTANPNTHLDISAGRAAINLSTDRVMGISPTVFTKRLDAAWASGNGNGGRFNSILGPNQTWHVFLIYRASTGAIDFGFDSLATGANAPSGWTPRLIGSIMTEPTNNNIRSFLQIGDYFYWNAIAVDHNSTNTSTNTANVQTLTVPVGLRLIALGYLDMQAPTMTIASISTGSPEATAYAGAISTNPAYTRTPFETMTNASGQIRLYADLANTFCACYTRGFIHPRGAW